MKRLILGLCVLGLVGSCGGKTARPGGAVGATGSYTATRWIPAQPSYAITARTVRDAQQNFRDLIETVGLATGDDGVAVVSAELRQLLHVDPLSAEAVVQLGVDLEGGLAMFSEGINPTIVVRLASAPAFQSWIEQQQLRTQSVVVDRVEVFTAPLAGARISWAVTDGWLWVHVALSFAPDDGTRWFSASRTAGAPTWTADLEWAKHGTEPPVVGFIDGARFLSEWATRMPAIAACARGLQLGAPGVGRVALALAGDTKSANIRIAVDVGGQVAGIESALLAPPEGWAAAIAQVPLALAWNLDYVAVRAKLDPCLQAFAVDTHDLDALGIRAARAFVRTFVPDEREGTGVVALDVTHKRFFESKLDDVPFRSTLERKRQFGPYAGKTLSIPMVATIDYVLTDKVVLAGIGEGLLASVIGKGAPAPGPRPIFEVAVQPLGLSLESWTELFQLVDLRNAKQIAARLQAWRDARVSLTTEGTRLVLAASGIRR